MEDRTDYGKPDAAPEDVEAARAAVDLLSPDQRVTLFWKYCRGCGTAYLPCYCEAVD